MRCSERKCFGSRLQRDVIVEFSIDTGADVTVIPEHIYQQTAGSTSLQPTSAGSTSLQPTSAGSTSLQSISRRLCVPNQYALSVLGKVVVKLKKGKCETEETGYVCCQITSLTTTRETCNRVTKDKGQHNHEYDKQ